MPDLTPYALAALLAAALLGIGPLLDGPSDTAAQRAVAASVAEAIAQAKAEQRAQRAASRAERALARADARAALPAPPCPPATPPAEKEPAMPAQPTEAALQAALTRIRALRFCAGWPDDVAAVLADPLRGPLLILNALHPPKPAAPRWYSPPSRWHAPALDRKRLAAGEREE